MDIMELGAIGELVGGVAVIGSLLFVGLQVRLSNRLARAEATRTWVHSYNTQIFAPLGDPERMQLYRDGLNRFDALDRNSQAAFHAQLMKIFLLGQSDFLLQRQGLADKTMASVVDSVSVGILRSPGLGNWWKSTKGVLHPDYGNHLEALRKASKGPGFTDTLPWYGPDLPAEA